VRLLDGFLLADKGAGLTSFQVVAHVRRVLRVPKVGHGGTLDPMATGVLPVLVGFATKLQPYLLSQDKEYLATIRLGVTTDTLDTTGRVLTERPVPPVDEATIRAALRRFVGEIEQVPPMFSALHAGGRRLHELARAGIEVERAPRRVRIDAFDLVAWALPRLTVRVACGSGTYVRSLAHDLGQALGPGAHLEALRRTRVGRFRLEEAVPWDVLRQADRTVLAAHVGPPDRAVGHLPAVRLPATLWPRLRHGQTLGSDVLPAGTGAGACRLYTDETFLGVGEVGAHGVRASRLLPLPDHADRSGTRPVSR
jgi:tRNA pseudouridine55 synthase